MPIYTPENTMGLKPRVFVDGEEIDQVFYADTDAGEVGRYKKDADGYYYLEDGAVATEALFGKVEVLDEDGEPLEPRFEVTE